MSGMIVSSLTAGGAKKARNDLTRRFSPLAQEFVPQGREAVVRFRQPIHQGTAIAIFAEVLDLIHWNSLQGDLPPSTYQKTIVTCPY
jgi:hypothetical protein